MAKTITDTVNVKELTKFGFKTDKDEYINWSSKLSDKEKAEVVPGVAVNALLFVSDAGKRYVNQINTVTLIKKPEDKPKPSSSAASMSKEEWKEKDRSQLIGGLSHDAAELTSALVMTTQESGVNYVLVTYAEILKGLLKIRDEVK